MKNLNKRIQSEDLSFRQRRVGEEVRALLSSFLMRGDFYTTSEFSGMITITEVRMSVDLKHAFAFVIPLGGEDMEGALEFLKELMPQLRSCLAKSLRLKSVPILHFEADRSFEEVQKLENILNSERVARDIRS